MTSINPTYNVNYLSGIKPKTKSSVTQSVSNPLPPQPNVSFRGTEALAAYNYNLVNKNKDFDKIPTLKPLEIPKNVEEIEGEKIYNSKVIFENQTSEKILKELEILTNKEQNNG